MSGKPINPPDAGKGNADKWQEKPVKWYPAPVKVCEAASEKDNL
ncbi:hypothetical protein [Niabella terrae]